MGDEVNKAEKNITITLIGIDFISYDKALCVKCDCNLVEEINKFLKTVKIGDYHKCSVCNDVKVTVKEKRSEMSDQEQKEKRETERQKTIKKFTDGLKIKFSEKKNKKQLQISVTKFVKGYVDVLSTECDKTEMLHGDLVIERNGLLSINRQISNRITFLEKEIEDHISQYVELKKLKEMETKIAQAESMELQLLTEEFDLVKKLIHGLTK